MAEDGKLNLQITDVHGARLAERVDINLFNQGLAERRVVRGVDASKKITISNLRSGPEGLYRIRDRPSIFSACEPIRDDTGGNSGRSACDVSGGSEQSDTCELSIVPIVAARFHAGAGGKQGCARVFRNGRRGSLRRYGRFAQGRDDECIGQAGTYAVPEREIGGGLPGRIARGSAGQVLRECLARVAGRDQEQRGGRILSSGIRCATYAAGGIHHGR